MIRGYFVIKELHRLAPNTLCICGNIFIQLTVETNAKFPIYQTLQIRICVDGHCNQQDTFSSNSLHYRTPTLEQFHNVTVLRVWEQTLVTKNCSPFT